MQPSKSHEILARRNGKEKYFTTTEWKAMPKDKYGWIEVGKSEKTKNIPPEAKEAITNQVKETGKKVAEISIDEMSAKELIDYVEKNSLHIEGYAEMTKSKLLKAIKDLGNE